MRWIRWELAWQTTWHSDFWGFDYNIAWLIMRYGCIVNVNCWSLTTIAATPNRHRIGFCLVHSFSVAWAAILASPRVEAGNEGSFWPAVAAVSLACTKTDDRCIDVQTSPANRKRGVTVCRLPAHMVFWWNKSLGPRLAVACCCKIILRPHLVWTVTCTLNHMSQTEACAWAVTWVWEKPTGLL